jgi:ATP adenylyltransferase
MSLDRFSAAWREEYVSSATRDEKLRGPGECVFCTLLADGVSPESGVIAITEHCFVVLNAYPYGSGHVLVLPRRHLADLGDLGDDEADNFFRTLRRVVAAVNAAYSPDGANVGFNLGRAAGAGIPQHLHGHVLPRWSGDTNFMTSVGETRVLPESLSTTWSKVSAAWNSLSGERL